MRRGDRRAGPGSAPARTRASAWAWLGIAGLLLAAPATALAQDEADRKIVDIAEPLGFGQKTVEGVGLVIGLAGTGSEPPPSSYRSKLEAEIKRNPELKVEEILADPLKRTSLVVVRAVITAGMAPEDELNVDVLLPPDSETTSLEGGFLVGCWLHEVGIAAQVQLEGKPWVYAYGPILTGNAADPDNPKVGRVLGGGRIKQEIPYVLLIGQRHRSGAVAKQLQDLINRRFQYRDGRFKKGVATAKTDNTIVLNVPERYHHNQLRYLQVLAQIRLAHTPELLESRMERWGQELLEPKTAGEAALKLEALGGIASPVLVKGLESEHPQVRFFSAEALAYLDDSAGSEELARAVVELPEFRTLALAALAAMDQPAGILRLRELMDQADPVVRYGAFNALRVSDPGDPALGRTRVLGLIEERRHADPDDAMAFPIEAQAPSPSRKATAEDPFELYVVRSSGPPMIHLSRSRRREIVLFGRDHELLPPVVLGGTGPILLNAALDDRRIEISRIELTGTPPQILTSSTDLVEVIRTVAALGATYPQVVSILEGAKRQANLVAELAIDAVPSEVEDYDRALLAGEDVVHDEAVSPASFEEEDAPEGAAERRGLGLIRRILPGAGGPGRSAAPSGREGEAEREEEASSPPASRRPGLFSRFLNRAGASELQKP
ncbi:flagellar basal body P-ring protein FlgI [Tautonia sociabilis]|uniref:Flagellar basal-body P-ring protein n=1 Tax=Tautonia sociabilis TaxID=2080755 RepID=A0A432MMS1_9BACT|nr:flagellar basal body P-ring protein FlgI [Tautonia sociabilis]RUL88741.1 flagellar basal-body P-ring protein [Tautonia sociabilis]